MDLLKKHQFHESVGFALNGIWQVVKTERNVKIHLGFAFLAVLLGLFFDITQAEWLALTLIIFLVISAEAFNSAVEAVCNVTRDRFSLGYDETKTARDVAAGAVLILVIGSIIIGLMIFLPYLNRLLLFHLGR